MAETGLVTIGKIEMPYAKFGSGPKNFVIIPGVSTRETTTFADAVESMYAAFKDEYTLYLIDRRRQLPEGYTIKDMADDTAKVLEALNIENATMFGASQGGMIIMTLAAYYPKLVDKLIIGSSEYRCNDILRAHFERWIAYAKNGEQDKLACEMAETMYSEATLAGNKAAIVEANKGLSDSEIEHFIRVSEALLSYDISDVIDKILCNCLVIGSEGDKIMGANSSVELAKALKSDLIMYGAEFGHTVYDEAPDYLARIKEWLSKN